MSDFAKVKDGKVIETYRSNKQYIDSNGVRFPPTIWQNKQFLLTQNIYKIEEGGIPDKNFYIIGVATLSFDAKAKTVLRSYTSTAKSTDELKNYFNDRNLSIFKSTVESTNYHIIRSQEDSNYKIPEAVSSWRATVNKEFDSHSTAIEKCGSIDDFKKLQISFTQQPDDVV